MPADPVGPDPALEQRLRASVRDVPDFPKPGIAFKDITPIVANAELFRDVVSALGAGVDDIDAVVGIESRGFIFAAPLAVVHGCAFVPFRKPRKLPYKTVRVAYGLEYGQDAIEGHVDALRPGARVLLVDDVLATGGTAAAAIELVRRLGGKVVAASFVLELASLGGRARLGDVPVRVLLTCE